MAILFSKLSRDVKKQNEGDWVSIPELIDPDDGKIPEILVRGNTYPPFQNALSQMNARQQRRGGQPDAETMHKEFGALIAKFLLLDWRNVGEEYSRDLAEAACTNYLNPLMGYVLRAASEVSEVTLAFDGAAAKNSERSSGDSLKAKAVA
jgi:hypothetical protein